ncbi:nucleotide-diphospho-sugar transferase [Lactarius hengduanensis]|nr:nucleotide-diphospho-sugar transferase [Lactarius hengduanensis]
MEWVNATLFASLKSQTRLEGCLATTGIGIGNVFQPRPSVQVVSPSDSNPPRRLSNVPLEVELIPPPHDGAGINYRFGDTYTKLRLWTLDQLGIQRVVYLDADTLVRRNFDELFDLPFPFAAVPDVYGNSGFKLHFNTGVLVLHTGSATFETMRAQIADARFDPREADQAFLNVYFGADAVRLPYVYNANLAIRERSPALWDALRDELRIVHYTLPKPFPKDGKEIVEGAALEGAIERARKDRGGVHVEAVEWWFTAYKEFRMENRVALRQCDV